MTEQDEKAVKAAVKLQETRDAMKRYFRDEYDNEIKPYMDLIKSVMKANDIDELQAFLKLSSTNAFHASRISGAMFTAAVVDIISPIKKQ